MIHYLLQTIAFQALFLLAYDLFLKRETFFNWNRVYLLVTAGLSFVLPFVQIQGVEQRFDPNVILELPAVILGELSPTVGAEPIASSTFSIWPVVWAVGGIIAVVLLSFKLVKIWNYKRQGVVVRFKEFTLIKLANSAQAFSFLKTIFLGSNLNEQQRETVLLHEQIHVKQRHTLDLLFFELLRILFWFNPLVYVYQNRMTTLQEYIADQAVADRQGKSAYYQELLSQVFQTQDISFINPFFNHSLIKKRINMLQKSKSSKSKLLKFAMLLPLVAVMVFYASCSQDADQMAAKAEANATTDVMSKIEELSEAIMAKGNLSDEEMKALEFLATPAKEGDKIYESIEAYLNDTALHESKVVTGYEVTETQELDVPFAKVDRVPVYPGCSGSNEELKACMTQKISQFIATEFNTKMANTLGLSGRQRISVIFKVDNTGVVTDIRARAPHVSLKDEAIRVTGLLPRMEPGNHEGKNVGVLYSLPIIFEVSE